MNASVLLIHRDLCYGIQKENVELPSHLYSQRENPKRLLIVRFIESKY